MAKMTVNFAWYYREQWDKVRSLSKDRTSMERLYDDWLKAAEESVKEFEAKGDVVHKVYIDVKMLEAWAKRKRMQIDGQTRTAYANQLIGSRMGMTDDI